jgi:hypothetical protein|tara:strand:+ start:736 stop:1344 length:609 start_codon:yes stop_codon:yes gene_type:complete
MKIYTVKVVLLKLRTKRDKMAFTVSEFKSNIASNGGGARPNLFTVSISGKTTAIGFDKDENILVKAAQIPGSTIAAQTLTYLGRPIKYTGFRTYDNWTTTVMNDENFTARDKISQWMRLITGKFDGERNKTFGPYATAGATASYFEGDAVITQLKKDGTDGPKYKIENIWPTSLAAIPVNWGTDGVETYDIEWCFDTFTRTS